jgi:hypothetical protein
LTLGSADCRCTMPLDLLVAVCLVAMLVVSWLMIAGLERI